MSMYPSHSPNRNGMNSQQRRFVEQQRQRRERQDEIERQVKRTHRRVRWARRISLALFLGCLSLICVGMGLILNTNSDPVIKPTAQAVIMNTPRETTTLQSPTWEAGAVIEEQPSANPAPNAQGYVVVPSGFWKIPGVAEAYRDGTPLEVLVAQYGDLEPVPEQRSAPQNQISAPDPRIEQAQNDLVLAQIENQITVANAEAQAQAEIAAASAADEIKKKQALTDRLIYNGRLAVDIISWLIIIVSSAALFRLVGLTLLDWLLGGLIDFLGNLGERLRFWWVEYRQPRTEQPPQPEIAPHLRELPISHYGSEKRQQLERSQQQMLDELGCTPQEIKIILDTWDEVKAEKGKGNYTECQRRAFYGNHGGEFYYRVTKVLDKYRPGHGTSAPQGNLEPYLPTNTP